MNEEERKELTLRDEPLTIHGVPGTFTCIARNETEWEKQRWTSEPLEMSDGRFAEVELRFDDDPQNNHNTFAMTGTVYAKDPNRYGRGDRNIESLGQVLKEIAEVLPPAMRELDNFHLVSTEGPMHYPANTLYLAGDRDYNGKAAGEPARTSKKLTVEGAPGVPVSGLKPDMVEKLDQLLQEGESLGERVEAPHRKGEFDTHYTFTNLHSAKRPAEWAHAPFRTLEEAENFERAFDNGRFNVETVVTEVSQGKERELESARQAACGDFPEDDPLYLSDETLSLPREDLKAALEDRLPELLSRFRSAMEACGFEWSPAEALAKKREAEADDPMPGPG